MSNTYVIVSLDLTRIFGRKRLLDLDLCVICFVIIVQLHIIGYIFGLFKFY